MFSYQINKEIKLYTKNLSISFELRLFLGSGSSMLRKEEQLNMTNIHLKLTI